VISAFLPDAISSFTAFSLVIASFFTSGLTAAAGIGGGMVMLALMAYLLPIEALIPVHGLVQLGSNAGRSWIQRIQVDWRVAKIFLIGSAVGASAGALVSVQLSETVLKTLLGAFILILVWVKFPALTKVGPFAIAVGGLASTFISMFAGATGPIVAVFLNTVFDEHRKLVATHAITMTVQHGLKVIAFGLVGFAFWEWVVLVAAMIGSGYAGTHAGTKLMNKLPEKNLKMLFKFVLTLVALDLLRRGVFA